MAALEHLLREGTELLTKAGIREARLDAWLLLEYTVKRNRAYFLAHPDETVPENAEQKYRELLEKRAVHVPLQHLTHQAFFMGCEFYVDERVLVPRQDTEILVEEALALLGSAEAPRILDLCTGSGCILLSILSEKAGSTGVGTDVSRDALKVAEENAKRLGLWERALFAESDLFENDIFSEKDGNTGGEYDIIVSNPPYIPSGEIGDLMEEVRAHDPLAALDGGSDGLYFYRGITGPSMRYLKPGGWLLYEIGCGQAEAVTELMRRAGFLDIRVRKDLSGLDRVVLGRKSAVTEQEESHV